VLFWATKLAESLIIVRAKDEFEASWQAAGEHPDVLEAAARREALSERWSELAMRVATTPAKTMEGMVAKFALIASGYAEDDLDGTYDGILASAALDTQALANARGGSAHDLERAGNHVRQRP
jgi:hypothetical protein